MPSNLPPCDCPADIQHSHQAWLEATLELGRLEHARGSQYDWRTRREFMLKLMHNWDISHPGKIEL